MKLIIIIIIIMIIVVIIIILADHSVINALLRNRNGVWRWLLNIMPISMA